MLSVFILTACKDVQTDTNNDLDIYLNKAQTYLKQHQLRSASQEANNAIDIAPTNLQAHLILADVYAQFGQFNRSIALLLNFNGIKNDFYYFDLIKNYQSAHKYFSAQKIFDTQSKWLQQQPERLQFLQAKQWIAQKKFSLAKKSLTKLLATTSNTYRVEAKLELATLYIVTKQSSKAIALLEKANNLSENNTLILEMLGTAYLTQKNYLDAEHSLVLALNTLPSSDFFSMKKVQILQQLMFALDKQGRPSEAMLYAKILADEFPTLNTRRLRYLEAKDAFEKGKLKESKQILLTLLEDYPQYKKASTLLGIIYYQKGMLKQAESYLSQEIDPELSNNRLTEIYAVTQLKLDKAGAVQTLLEGMPEAQYSAKTWALYISASLREKTFIKAKKALQKAQNLYPDEVNFVILQSLYFNRQSPPMHAKALALLKQRLDKDPLNELLQVTYLKQLLLMQKESSSDQYAQQLQNNPKSTLSTHLMLANYFLSKKKYAQGEALLNKILSKDKQNIEALYKLNNFYFVQGKYAQALTNYQRIIEQDNSQLKAYFGLINSLLAQKKDPLQAKKYLGEDHNASLLSLALSSWAVQTNNLALANELLTSNENTLPVKFHAYEKDLKLQLSLKNISVLMQNKEYIKARTALLEIIKDVPDELDALVLLAKINIQQSKFPQAQRVIDKLFVHIPNHQEILLLQASLYIAEDKIQNAILVYEQILSDTPKHLTSLNNLAWFYFIEKDNRAIKLAEQAYQIAPKNASILDTYGWILANTGEIEKGKEMIEKAFHLNPQDLSIKKHLDAL